MLCQVVTQATDRGLLFTGAYPAPKTVISTLTERVNKRVTKKERADRMYTHACAHTHTQQYFGSCGSDSGSRFSYLFCCFVLLPSLSTPHSYSLQHPDFALRGLSLNLTFGQPTARPPERGKLSSLKNHQELHCCETLQGVPSTGPALSQKTIPAGSYSEKRS